MKQQHIAIVTVAILALVPGARGLSPLVPVSAETRVTTNADASVTAQTVERIQLHDGQTTDWRNITSVTRPTKTGGSETTETIVEHAARPQLSQTIQRTTHREKTGAGETVRINEITRNAFGKETSQRVVEETATRESDGATSVRIVEQATNPRGQLAVEREEQRHIRELSPSRNVIESQIRTYDHLRGRFDVTAVQNTEVRKQGDTTHAESVIRRTTGGQDRIVGRVLTTETKTDDGAAQREIVEYGQGLHDKFSYRPTGELKPQRKIVERTVQKPDGTVALKREVFRYDVNGDWKPAPHNWVGDQP